LLSLTKKNSSKGFTFSRSFSIFVKNKPKINNMSNNFEITKELKATLSEFLNSYGSYKECLNLIENEEKLEFSEDEINKILNLLGTFRLMDTFHIVERFKIEVTPLKDSVDAETSEPTTTQAG